MNSPLNNNNIKKNNILIIESERLDPRFHTHDTMKQPQLSIMEKLFRHTV